MLCTSGHAQAVFYTQHYFTAYADAMVYVNSSVCSWGMGDPDTRAIEWTLSSATYGCALVMGWVGPGRSPSVALRTGTSSPVSPVFSPYTYDPGEFFQARGRLCLEKDFSLLLDLVFQFFLLFSRSSGRRGMGREPPSPSRYFELWCAHLWPRATIWCRIRLPS